MFMAWLEGEDPMCGDGHFWNAPTARDAADMHVDEVVIPSWGDLGNPGKVLVVVQEHENDETQVTFIFEIDVEPIRGFGRVTMSST